MGSNEDEMALLVAAPQLRRSPRRHGSDSDLDTTVGTTAIDTTANDTTDTVDVELSATSSSFSPFKPKLMRCTSTPANLMVLARPSRSRMPPPVMPRFVPHHSSEISSIASSVISNSSTVDSCCTDTSDSGLGSTDISTYVSPVVQAKSGAIPKRTTQVVTRSRKSSSGLDSDTFLSPQEQPAVKTRRGGGGRRSKLVAGPRDISRRWADETTPSPLSRASTHRFTVESPGLFINRDHLDFVRRLASKNMSHILEKIWSLLPTSDLSSAMQVSSLWYSSVKASSTAMSRWREAKAMWSPENAKTLSGKKGRSQRKARLLKTSPRKALGNVSNLLADESLIFEASSDGSLQSTRLRQRSSSRANPLPPPVLASPSKFRHRLFTDEASRLKPEEQLRPCPRCTLPSKVNLLNNRAHCTRISCQFDFCTKCMCGYHGESPCHTSVKVASSKGSRGRKNLNFSSAMSSDLETSDMSSSAAGKTQETKNIAPISANASLNSSKKGRQKLAATVASDKSKSRLKRL